uniref:Uncharacterized protein n=1 Tax=viral metagenome TaxID=1070528 RepID=A0A6C0KM42_9ZZZZ
MKGLNGENLVFTGTNNPYGLIQKAGSKRRSTKKRKLTKKRKNSHTKKRYNR